MKNLLLVFVMLLCFACKEEEKQLVEMSCGQCQFGLTSQNGCDLAVRMDNQAYFVDGAKIDDFGDAHAEDTGFCEVIRKAEITGALEGDRFQVTTVELMD
ncbi:MAG: DUF6370 family protein [Aquaticitalea sp.]